MVDRFRLRSFVLNPEEKENKERRRSRLSIIVRGTPATRSAPPQTSSSPRKRPFSSFFENRRSDSKDLISYESQEVILNDPSIGPNQSEVLESLDLIDLGPVESEEKGKGKGKGKEKEKEKEREGEEEGGEGGGGEEEEGFLDRGEEKIVEEVVEDPLKSVPFVGLNGGGLPRREGFLFKQGHLFRTWKKRYFSLSPEKIQYFSSANKKVLKGELLWSPKTYHCLKEPCFYSHLLIWDVPSPPPPPLCAQLKKEAGLGEEEIHLFAIEVRLCDERKREEDRRRWRRKREDKEIDHSTSSPSSFPGVGGDYQSSQLLLCVPSKQEKIEWLLDLSAHQAPLPPPSSSSSSLQLDDDLGVVGKGGAGIGSQLHSSKWNTRKGGGAGDSSLLSSLDLRFSRFSEGGEEEGEGEKEEIQFVGDGFSMEDLEKMSFDSFVNE